MLLLSRAQASAFEVYNALHAALEGEGSLGEGSTGGGSTGGRRSQVGLQLLEIAGAAAPLSDLHLKLSVQAWRECEARQGFGSSQALALRAGVEHVLRGRYSPADAEGMGRLLEASAVLLEEAC